MSVVVLVAATIVGALVVAVAGYVGGARVTQRRADAEAEQTRYADQVSFNFEEVLRRLRQVEDTLARRGSK